MGGDYLWGTMIVHVCTGFRAARIKLMSQPSIKRALTSLNYRWCKIKHAGLFGGSNVIGWQRHVIFSMLLVRGLYTSQPHLELFLTRAACKIDSTARACMKKLTLILFVTPCIVLQAGATVDPAQPAEVMQFYRERHRFYREQF